MVATQVKTIQDCIKKFAVVSNRDLEYQHLPPGLPPVKLGNFIFEGDMISLTPSTYILKLSYSSIAIILLHFLLLYLKNTFCVVHFQYYQYTMSLYSKLSTLLPIYFPSLLHTKSFNLMLTYLSETFLFSL